MEGGEEDAPGEEVGEEVWRLWAAEEGREA